MKCLILFVPALVRSSLLEFPDVPLEIDPEIIETIHRTPPVKASPKQVPVSIYARGPVMREVLKYETRATRELLVRVNQQLMELALKPITLGSLRNRLSRHRPVIRRVTLSTPQRHYLQELYASHPDMDLDTVRRLLRERYGISVEEQLAKKSWEHAGITTRRLNVIRAVMLKHSMTTCSDLWDRLAPNEQTLFGITQWKRRTFLGMCESASHRPKFLFTKEELYFLHQLCTTEDYVSSRVIYGKFRERFPENQVSLHLFRKRWTALKSRVRSRKNTM